MFKIGNISIKNKVFLAPMAGISNPTYFRICEEFGLGYAVTELISSEAIVRDNKKTFDMLKGIDKLNIPFGIQIFGSNPEVMGKAASVLEERYKPSFIDINMGCPVPKVIKSGAGSYLMRDKKLVFDIVSSVVRSISIPVTVKIRSGWDSNSINAKEIAIECEKAGASAIAVHARTRSQGYSGEADWKVIKEVKKSVSVPVIGNGDVKSLFDAERMISETGCDAVMIGRGVLGNPWLIKNSINYLSGKELIDVSVEDKIDMCLKHLDLLKDLKNEKIACLEIRNHIAWYLRNVPGGKEIKNKIFKETNINAIIDILNEYKSTILDMEEEHG